jgi:pimeloyl-ACP methyl ester carboxylesterase
VLRDRLRRAGFEPHTFHYHSMQASLEDACAALAAQLQALGDPCHVVAHSLGGVVTLETYARNPDLPSGRIVLLGAPVQGSRAARAVARWSLGPRILGGLAVAELCRPRSRRWDSPREIGLVAGSGNVGLGRLFAELPLPNDGTICVDETLLPGATAHSVLDVTHTGMLVSTAVASAVVRFLRRGSF